MKKLLFAGMLLLSLSLTAQNQYKTLLVQDITPELSVYPCGDRPEALVVIHCSEEIGLNFSSNVDSNLDITTLSDGSETIYNIVFQTRANGTTFKGRQLTINANGFNKYYLPLELKEKQKLEFLVSDPYSKLRSIFYTSTEDGQTLFAEGAYLAAKDQFNIAKQCPEYTAVENNIDTYLAQCDTMILWTSIIDQAEAGNDYALAKEYLEKMRYMNPLCPIVLERYNNVSTEFSRQCAYDMNVGIQYMTDKKYDLARERFEHSIAIKSPSATQAALNLETISLINYKSDNHTRTMFYQISDGCNIGFMAASLKPEKAGGYFSLGFDNNCPDFLSNKLEPVTDVKEAQFKCMASAGWTINLYYPKNNDFIPHVWLLFTPFGYAGGGYVWNDLESENMEEVIKKKTSYFNAIVPEAGLAIRIWRIVLNYKYQYRYVLENDPISDIILPKNSHSFGVGFCW